MSNTKTIMGQASNQYVTPTDITDVFSTYLYDGTGAAQTITNGIDLAGEGGLVWIKQRNTGQDHILTDTERGAGNKLTCNGSNASDYDIARLSSFNSDGFSVGNNTTVSNASGTYASWTFRKAPKFFDCVQYTGTGVIRTVNHSLGSVPGMVIVKRTDTTGSWRVYHRGSNATAPENYYLTLNATDQAGTGGGVIWNDTAPTDSVFTVGANNSVNATGGTYVAYLFAHNNSDGEFGPDGSDIIKCGSYTGNGSNTGPVIDLGFEPQWLMFKRTTDVEDWIMFDNMRGMSVGGIDPDIRPNLSQAEGAAVNYVEPTATGFKITNANSRTNGNGDNYIYMAIRRGPLAPPTAATEVFAPYLLTANQSPMAVLGSPVDMTIHKYNINSSTQPVGISSRLTAEKYMFTNTTGAEVASGLAVPAASAAAYDYQTGVGDGATLGFGDDYAWMWKRAPSFCDVVCYTGNSTAGHTISHNLGVAPEMIWVKRRESNGVWGTYHSGVDATSPEDFYLKVESTDARDNDARFWNDTAPTDTVFTLGTHSQVNFSGGDYIAYLFSTLAGVSKVGSYTGTGTHDTHVIDCGFTTGARFVLLKRTDATSDWFLWDSVRGITNTADPRLSLNTTTAQYNGLDDIRPDPSGFIAANPSGSDVNASGSEWIFYAIA